MKNVWCCNFLIFYPILINSMSNKIVLNGIQFELIQYLFLSSVSPLVFRPTYLFRNRWLPTKFPLLQARRQARARLLREYSILSGESSLTFFSSESTVPRAFADRFVRVKSIYYLVPGIFLFAETLWMVCCIVSVWKILAHPSNSA
jgi:hypothetical protein